MAGDRLELHRAHDDLAGIALVGLDAIEALERELEIVAPPAVKDRQRALAGGLRQAIAVRAFVRISLIRLRRC